MDATSNDKEQCMPNKGRQKTGLKKVEKQSNRSVTFSKRKKGLFKKATELSALCGAETAVIIFSERGKLFSCGQPNVDEVIGRYLAKEETEKANDRYHKNYCLIDNVNDFESQQRQQYLKSLKRLEKVKKVANKIENTNNVNNNGGFWWDQSIDNLDEEELEAYKESMEELKLHVMARVELMMNANNAYDTGFNNSEL